MSNLRTMTTREVAATFEVSTRTVARWVEDGRIAPAVKAPGRTGALLFDAEQIAQLVTDSVTSCPDGECEACDPAAVTR